MTEIGDSPRVGNDENEALRRFVAARDAGDDAALRRWWGVLVEVTFDRVHGMVTIEAHRRRLTPEQRDDALQGAMERICAQMVTTFAGTSMGELVNALRTCATFACIDEQRAVIRLREREAALDRGPGDDDGPDPYAGAVAKASRERRRAEEEQSEREGLLVWALPQIRNERQRAVLERTLEGVPAAEIAAELGVSMDNLYQLRSRGTRELGRLKEQYDA